MLLLLNVVCNDDNTMDVTSDHLEVAPFPMDFSNEESGEELSKRGEFFGHPCGKSRCRLVRKSLLLILDLLR